MRSSWSTMNPSARPRGSESSTSSGGLGNLADHPNLVDDLKFKGPIHSHKKNIWCPASSNAFQPWTYSCLGFYLSEFRDIPPWDFCLLPRQTVELIFGAHSSRKKKKKGIQNSTAASIPTLPRKIMPQKVLNKVFFRIVCRPYCWNSFTDVSEEMAPTKQKKKNSLHGFCGDKKLNYHIRNIRKASTPWWVGNDSTV